MTTTIMRDSIVGDQWIQQTAANVPIQKQVDPQTGEWTGDFLTGPVRIAFPNLFRQQKNKKTGEDRNFNCALLFTPYADFTLLYEDFYRVCAEKFPRFYNSATGQYAGIASPFHDQAEKPQYAGYTPGCVYVNASTQYKPQIVDINFNPIVQEDRVYPGVWGIASINQYGYDNEKRGVSVGLQSLMLIGDDNKLGGGAPDPNKTFGGVKGAIAAPAIPAGHMAGMPGAPAQPPAPTMPGAPPGGTYAQMQPPMMPGQPAPGAAPADPRGPVPAGFASWAAYDELFG